MKLIYELVFHVELEHIMDLFHLSSCVVFIYLFFDSNFLTFLFVSFQKYCFLGCLEFGC